MEDTTPSRQVHLEPSLSSLCPNSKAAFKTRGLPSCVLTVLSVPSGRILSHARWGCPALIPRASTQLSLHPRFL